MVLGTKEFKAVEPFTKIGAVVEHAKSTKYIRKVDREIEYYLKEKKAIETRLKFLYTEREKALHYRLIH